MLVEQETPLEWGNLHKVRGYAGCAERCPSGVGRGKRPRRKSEPYLSVSKECIGIGVSDYLLKPIVRAEINDTLHKIIGQLDDERNQAEPDETIDEIGGYSITIEEIIKYIKDNYEDKTLNLTSVSKMFGFNSSYLSRKFKEETGQGLSVFLTEVRMEKAKELAKKGTIMYMTAQKVGIPDPNYFGKLFKRNVGITYSAYLSGE